VQKWEYLYLARRIDYKYGGLLAAGLFEISWGDGDEMGFEERLNYLGDQGWEVVSIYPICLMHGGSTNTSDTTSIGVVLKRPKEEV